MLKDLRNHIWFAFENWEDEWDIYDENVDVGVTFSDRSHWMATFFTYKNIETLRERYKESGECMSGAYFKASDMVLIDMVSRERIEEVIEYLLENDEFESTFTRYPDVKTVEEDDYPDGFFVDD